MAEFLAKFKNPLQGQLISTSYNENRGQVIQQRVLYKVRHRYERCRYCELHRVLLSGQNFGGIGCNMAISIASYVFLDSSLQQENSNIISLIPSLSSGANAVSLYYSPVAPSSHSTGMHIEKTGYFARSQHISYLFKMCHLVTIPLYKQSLVHRYNRTNE